MKEKILRGTLKPLKLRLPDCPYHSRKTTKFGDKGRDSQTGVKCSMTI